MFLIPGCPGHDHWFRKYAGNSIKFNLRANHDPEYGKGKSED
jgi:hypothetical protein